MERERDEVREGWRERGMEGERGGEKARGRDEVRGGGENKVEGCRERGEMRERD